MSTRLLFFAALLAATASVSAQKNPDDICGKWQTNDKDGVIEIYKHESGRYFGKIVGGANTGGDRLDAKNPKPDLRTRKLLGLDILKNLEFKGENDWGNGTIYDPNTGGEYSLFVSLDGSNTLKLRGFVGVSLFGRTETWTRISK